MEWTQLFCPAVILHQGRPMLTSKKPRDFVLNDELWPADSHWSNYFPGQRVWILMDEYHAQLPGDQNYCRIIVSDGNSYGWIYSRPIVEKQHVETVLQNIELPVSEHQLSKLGFLPWSEHD